ncbi:hypothetical protein LJR129_003250 [Acidovorax sp. LjRoot129]|uniref:hypothetical protein n=1 Tax=Acidovorax sp. LjRoot129 TaxID=3342260 RepID=UPI003ECCB153
MRRLLLTFLLVFLPLQSIWAAASPYCAHEAAPQASHFGHHAHEHHAGASMEHAESSVSPGAGEALDLKALGNTGPGAMADIDCHACHGAGSGMALSTNAQAIVVTVARPVHHVTQAWVHPPLSRPERPNWSFLA